MKPLSPEKYPNCNVEALYKIYLSAVKLHEENMSKEQKVETRRAYYAAVASTLMLLRDEISQYDEMTGIQIMQRMLNQVDEFFRKETDLSGLPLEVRVLLETLQRQSQNASVLSICDRVLKGQTTIEHELKYSGSFMTEILKGDPRKAFLHADYENKLILQSLGIGKEKNL